jgi:hypothetical protein
MQRLKLREIVSFDLELTDLGRPLIEKSAVVTVASRLTL